MAAFFSNLFDKIQNIFKTKKLDDNITDFQRRMDIIITDLILPYAQPQQQVAAKDRFRDLITLLDPKQCNKIAITMSNNLDKNYTKLQLEQFASNILVGREQTKCDDETCSSNSVPSIDNKNKKVSKKEICNAIAIHYVKILNLISAVLTAVNPMDNICLNRLRNLLTIISEDEQKGISGICDPAADVVKQSIMHEPGFKELLMLYYYHLMQDTETEEEKTNVRNQYQIFVKTLSNLVMFVDPSLKESPEINAMVARELSGRNEDENEANEEQENNEDLEDLENLEQESNNAVKLPEVSTNNIANIRKNISNFKANENAKLNSIITKIEGLNQIIANIQSNTQEKTREPMPSTLEPMPSTLEPIPSTLEPMPTSMEPMPTSTEPMPTSMEPMPSTLEPIPSTLEPVPSTQEPTTNTIKPMTTTMEPEPSDVKADLSEPDSGSDSETESDYDDDEDEDDEEDDEDEDNENTMATVSPSVPSVPSVPSNSGIPSVPSVPSVPSNSGMPSVPSVPSVPSNLGISTTSTESLLPKTLNTSTTSEISTKTSNGTQAKSNNKQAQEINDLLNQINETQTGGADSNNNNLNKQIKNVLNNGNNGNNANNGNNGNNRNNRNNRNNANNGNKQNEPMMNTNSINNTINTQELKTNNTLLDKFLEFVGFYAKIDKIDPKIIEIVNTAFKTYDKFSNETKMEADLRITEDDFDNFCINNINDNAQIPITLNDPRLSEYLKIYKDLKSVYLDNCEYLLNLLEKQVLIKDKQSDDDTKSHFTIREISYTDLAALETDVRNRLVNMYSQCQQNYQAGIKALFNALKTENKEI